MTSPGNRNPRPGDSRRSALVLLVLGLVFLAVGVAGLEAPMWGNGDVSSLGMNSLCSVLRANASSECATAQGIVTGSYLALALGVILILVGFVGLLAGSRPSYQPAGPTEMGAAAATEWAPTHVVPEDGTPAWLAPDANSPPSVRLEAGVELKSIATTGSWALVCGANGWQGWVDGRCLLTPPYPPAGPTEASATATERAPTHVVPEDGLPGTTSHGAVNTPPSLVAQDSPASRTAASQVRPVILETTRFRTIAQRAARRLRALDRRVKAIVLTVPIVAGVGFVAVSTINSPDNQVHNIVNAVAQRQYPNDLDDATTFVRDQGILAAPAGVTFSVTAWSLRDTDSTYQAAWTLVARGSSGRTATSSFSASFSKASDAYSFWSFSGDPVDVTALVPLVSGDKDVLNLVTATNQLNQPFNVTSTTASETVVDDSAALIAPIEIKDPTILNTEAASPVADKPGRLAQVAQTFLVVDGHKYLVRQVKVAGEPATVNVGTLDPSTLTQAAAQSLDAIVVAQKAKDVVAAMKYLVHGDGLEASGLAASTAKSYPASALAIQGTDGDYSVKTPDGLTLLRNSDGLWCLDYTGQPLEVLYPTPANWTQAGTVNYTNVESAMTAEPVTILAGNSQTVTLVLHPSAGTNSNKDADYFAENADIYFRGLTVAAGDGTKLSVDWQTMVDTTAGTGALNPVLTKAGSLCPFNYQDGTDHRTSKPASCTIQFAVPSSLVSRVELRTVIGYSTDVSDSSIGPVQTIVWK